MHDIILTELRRYEEQLPEVREAGIAALKRLLEVAKRDTGQSGVVALFLLGLYNGRDFKFDMTELRRLDHSLFEDCLTLLRMDHNPEQEVHQYVENGQAIWQDLRRDWISDQGQLFAEIRKTSKYAHQADMCRSRPCGYPFRVTISADEADDGFIVKGGVGGRYRLEDVRLYMIERGKKVRVH
ncbi:hypothetical protein AB2C92_07285 [Pseudomonas aeruginosa]